MLRRLAALLIVVFATGTMFAGDKIRAENPDEGPWIYSFTSKDEGSLRFDMPAGLHFCRFRVDYPSEGLTGGTFIEATAWLVDEDYGQVERFDWSTDDQQPNPIYIVGISPPLDTASDAQKSEFARNLRQQNWKSWRMVLADPTPRLEVSLSRLFRHYELAWTFQCAEALWPDFR